MFLFDLHCDTLTKCFNSNKDLYFNDLAVDIKELLKFDKTVQTFAVFTDDSGNFDHNYVFDCIDHLYSFCSDRFQVLNDFNNLNRCSAIVSIENLSFIGDDLSIINQLSYKGVKMASLTWNDDNGLASGVNGIGGLTDFGRVAVRHLEDCNIIIDVSHLNDCSFYDVYSATKKSIIASHSNCRSICGNKRNLTDNQIRCITVKGGLIGLNLYPMFVNGTDSFTFDELCLHIDHLIKLGAEDNISIGSDFDGCKMCSYCSVVSDLKPLYQQMCLRYGTQFCNKLFFNNAYNFFVNME